MDRAHWIGNSVVLAALSCLALPLPAAESYQLQVVAFSLDYPSNPAAQLRTFFAPQINEHGQVLFGASWREDTGGQSHLYLGRPGALTRAHSAETQVTAYPELKFGGPSFYMFNAEGELMFFSGVAFLDPAKLGAPFAGGIWRGKPGILAPVVILPWGGDPPLTPMTVSNLPAYTGTGRPYFASAIPWRLADNATGYMTGSIYAIEGGNPTPVITTDALFTAGTASQRLIWYREGPAPGLGGDYLFHQLPHLGRPVVAQKNGNYVAATTVKLRGETDPSAFKTAYYAGWFDEFAPFYVQGDPLPGLPPLESFLPPLTRVDDSYRLETHGADVVDFTGNTYLEVSARSRSTAPSIGIWKKLPEGLVPALRFNQDYPVGSATLRFSAEGLTGGIAMGNGRLAFTARYTGPGVPLPQPGLFRETATGFELIAFGNMTVPGTNLIMPGDFGNLLAPLLMNERGEVVFVAHYNEPGGAPIRALWLSDEDRRLHRIIHVGQTLNIGGANRTVFRFETANHDAINPADPKLVFNNTGLLAFTVTFTDNTKAIIRAVPAGYQDPVPQGPDYWFNGRVGNNWHSSAPTNWENFAKQPNTQPPGDADAGTAIVFIPPQYSVMLNQRAASIGSLDAEGDLTLQHLLTLNYSSRFRKNLIATGPNGGLRLNNSAVNAETTTWNGGTLTLANSTFRNQNRFIATAGSVAHAGGTSAFENRGVFEKQGAGVFTVDVPFHVHPPTSSSSDWIEVAGGTLRLVGGGSFAESAQISSATGTTLQLAGQFTTENGVNFDQPRVIDGRGDDGGRLDLGTSAQDIDLIAEGLVSFQNGGQGVHFNRGELRGGARPRYSNSRQFYWNGGRITTGSGTFENHGHFEIAATPNARRLSGKLTNTDNFVSSVRQLGSFELAGVIENLNPWAIEAPATIVDLTGASEFINRDNLNVFLPTGGTVAIECRFTNRPLSRYHWVSVGKRDDETPDGGVTRLELRGPITNLSSGLLKGGFWWAAGRGALVFSGDVETISGTAILAIGFDGEIPSLKLKKIIGYFLLFQRAKYSTPDSLEVVQGYDAIEVDPSEFTLPDGFGSSIKPDTGKLEVKGGSVLTVNGSLTSRGTIICEKGSRIIVKGHLAVQAGELQNDGEIIVEGRMTLRGGRQSGDGVIKNAAGEDVFVDYEEAMVVASAGTTTGIEGSATFSDTSALGIDIAGASVAVAASHALSVAGTDRPRAATSHGIRVGVLAVTRALSLGGTLLVNLAKEVQPAITDVLTIVQAGSISGQFLNARSGERVPTTDGRGTFQIFYGTGSPHAANHVVLTNWQPSAAGFLIISAAPATQTITAGNPLALSVTASGAGTLTYQWRYRGTNIPGAITASYTVPSAQREHAGLYSVVVTNSMGSVVSNVANISVAPPRVSNSRLVNVSTRALIPDGNEPLIPGFVVQGTSNARLLVRAVGPALSNFGVEDALPNPQIAVKRLVGSAYVDHASNNDWSTNTNAAEITAAATAVGAFPLSQGALDSALLLDLAPGQYTVVTDDVANRSGVAIVELYNVTNSATDARVINISTRAFVGTGADVMIPGFVISPEGARTLLVRAVGPTLGAFGVSDVLSDPQLTIYGRLPDGSTGPILSNNDWGAAPGARDTADVAAEVGAFPLPANSKDAALVVTLPPGPYTVHVSGVGGTTGNALVEVYVVP